MLALWIKEIERVNNECDYINEINSLLIMSFKYITISFNTYYFLLLRLDDTHIYKYVVVRIIILF